MVHTRACFGAAVPDRPLPGIITLILCNTSLRLLYTACFGTLQHSGSDYTSRAAVNHLILTSQTAKTERWSL